MTLLHSCVNSVLTMNTLVVRNKPLREAVAQNLGTFNSRLVSLLSLCFISLVPCSRYTSLYVSEDWKIEVKYEPGMLQLERKSLLQCAKHVKLCSNLFQTLERRTLRSKQMGP